MASLGSIFVDLILRKGQYDEGLKQSESRTTQFANNVSRSLSGINRSLQNMGVAIIGVSFVGLLKSSVEMVDQFGDLAQRIGFSASTLSALDVKLKQTGTDLETFATSAGKLNDTLGNAAKGNQEAVSAFDELGLSVNALLKLNPEQRFSEVARAIAKISDQAKQTEAVRNIFGKGGDALLPAIKELNGEFDIFAEAQKKAGNALTDDDIKRIKEFADAWVAGIQKIQIEIAKLLPLFEDIAKVPAYLRAIFIEIPSLAGQAIGNKLAGRGLTLNNPNVSFNRPNSVNEATIDPGAIDRALRDRGLTGLNQAAGSNAGLIKNPALDKFKDQLRDLQVELFQLRSNEDDATKAAEKLALQAGLIKFDEGMIKIPAESKKQFDELNATLKEIGDRKEAAKIIEDSKTALDKYNESIATLNRLFAENLINQDQFNKAMKKASDDFAENDEATKQMRDTVKELGLTFSSAFEDAVSGGKGFQDILKGIESDLLRLGTRKLVTEPFANFFNSQFNQSGASGGFGGLFGGIGKLFGFATGGSFEVGGSGGTDSQMVAFRGTPGEKVTITRPDQQTGGNQIIMNINTPDAGSFMRSQGQILARTQSALDRAQRRNG